MQNKEVINQKISELFIQTMQEMAFVDVALSSKNVAVPTDAVAVKLEVLMPYSGDLVITFEKDLAKEFAINVFGAEQIKELQDPVLDAASEFLNVIIGKIFAEFAPDLLFELGLPQTITNPKAIDPSPYLVHSYISPEGKNIIFYFRLDRLINAFQTQRV